MGNNPLYSIHYKNKQYFTSFKSNYLIFTKNGAILDLSENYWNVLGMFFFVISSINDKKILAERL